MASHIDVSVITNSFTITRLPTKEYYQYDVFQPDLPIAHKRQRAIHLLQTSVAPGLFHPRGVYDGKRLLYLSHVLQLPGGGARFPVSLGNNPNAPVGSPGVVEVVLTKTASGTIRPKDLNKLIQSGQTIDQNTATATNLLQLLIRQSSNHLPGSVRVTHNPSIGSNFDKGTGVELWRGFFQSVRPTIGSMLITIDTSMAAVYESGRLIDVSMNVINSPHFKNRLIKTKTTGDRTKTIHAIVPGPIGQFAFEKDGATITIEEYFYKAHSIRLAYPKTFGVRLSGRNAPFPVIVPAELCAVLPGQLYKKRLPTSATKDAVDFATMAPQARLQTITGGTTAGVQSPIQSYHTSEFVVDAGMVINQNPIKTQNGAWNVVRQKFKTPTQLKVWGVVNFDAIRIRQDLVDKTIYELIECCRQLAVAPPAAVQQGEGHSPEKVKFPTNLSTSVLRQMPNSGPPDLIIVLLPSKADEIRTRVKFWGDVTRGVRTSCLREDKLQRAGNQYFNNVALKINARLGGHYALPRSAVLERLKTGGPYMICGADVAHPGPGLSRPSIASLASSISVFSWDAEAASYIAYSEVQAPRQEIIEGLGGMVKRAIFQFGKKNPPPRRIVFFRDGVSEGELETVKNAEIAAIKAACREHHTVFFPNDPRVNDGKTGNCRAGLVVDALRSPLARDFYLQSHGAIKGTSRSGHYTILLDEIFNNDISSVQRLSFELCHVYAKATRSISIPAPLVCARGKFHIDPSRNLDFDASTNASGSEDFDLQYWEQAYRAVNGSAHYDKGMYFL
ncbi:argonaute-like protein [Mycena vulgaris]|nr:argonaute-like protein [Mycena vulgaris]